MSSDLALTVARLEKAVRDLQNANRLNYSSLENARIPVYDENGVIRQIIGQQPDGTYTIIDQNAPAPPQPETPTVTGGTGLLAVTSYGQTTTGVAWPSDLARIDVHVGSASGFTPSAATKVGEFTFNGGTLAVPLGEGRWYAKLVAVNTSGIESVPSGENTAVVAAPAAGEAGSDGLAPTEAPLVAAVGAYEVVYLDWAAVNNPDDVLYEVHGSTVQGFGPTAETLLDLLSNSRLTVGSLRTGALPTDGTPVFFKVRAVDPDGPGPWTEVSATAKAPVTQDDLDVVQGTAGDAATAAYNAQQAADAAASAAAAAQADADAAATQASNAAAAAAAAQDDADAAETKALEALGVANGKTDVVFQATAPTGDPNIYWVNTSTGRGHRWDTTLATPAWVEIQDEAVQTALSNASAAQQKADDAATAAATAQGRAESAESDAAAAQSTADAASGAAAAAQSTANDASLSASNAQEAADAAASAASLAQQRADDAQADADAAAGVASSAAAAAARAAAAAENRVLNASFEGDLADWVVEGAGITTVTEKARTGTRSAKTTGSGAIRQGPIAVAAGEVWRFSWLYQTAAAYPAGAAGGLRLQRSTDGGATFSDAASSSLAVGKTAWEPQQVEYAVPAGTTHIRARVAFAYAGGAAAWFDDLRLANVTEAVRLEADAENAAQAAAAAQADATAAATAASSAKTAAQTAQETADARTTIYRGDEPPWPNGSARPASDTGAEWHDRNNGHLAHSWDGDSWEPKPLGPSAASQDIIAGKVVPINQAQSLGWGVPNPLFELDDYAIKREMPVLSDAPDPGSDYTVRTFYLGLEWNSTTGKFTTIQRRGDDAIGAYSEYAPVTMDSAGPVVGAPIAALSGDTHITRDFCRVGTEWAALVEPNNNDALGDYEVWFFDDNWALLRKITVAYPADSWADFTGLTYDGTYLVTSTTGIFVSTEKLLRFNRTTGAFVSEVAIGWTDQPWVHSLSYGAFGTGANHVAASTSTGEVFLINPGTGALHASRPTIGAGYYDARGSAWDGSRVCVLNHNGALHRATARTTTQSLWLTYTYYDSNPEGGTHETAAGPVKSAAISVAPGHGVTVMLNLPGFTDAQAPDTFRLYATIGGTSRPPASSTRLQTPSRQWEEAGTHYIAVDTFTTTGSAPPTVSTFPSGQSGALLSEQGGFEVYGDGTGQWPYLEDYLTRVYTSRFAAAGHNHDTRYPTHTDLANALAQEEAARVSEDNTIKTRLTSLEVPRESYQVGVGSGPAWGAGYSAHPIPLLIFRTGNGWVNITGTGSQANAGSGTTMFVLPENFRPAATIGAVQVWANGGSYSTRVDITAAGHVVVFGVSNSPAVHLGTISYLAG